MTELYDLPGLIAEYGALKDRREQLRDSLDEVTAEMQVLKDAILARMAASGAKSAEDHAHHYLVSRKATVDIEVVDEAAAIDWIRRQPDLDEEVYVGLKATYFKPIARVALKKDGEVPDGCEIKSGETLSVKHQEVK